MGLYRCPISRRDNSRAGVGWYLVIEGVKDKGEGNKPDTWAGRTQANSAQVNNDMISQGAISDNALAYLSFQRQDFEQFCNEVPTQLAQ